MNCEKCQDKGFIEKEHGLICVFCDCEKGKAKKEEITGVKDDSDSGTGQPDRAPGSKDTGKPKRTRKPKTQKKAGKRAK